MNIAPCFINIEIFDYIFCVICVRFVFFQCEATRTRAIINSGAYGSNLYFNDMVPTQMNDHYYEKLFWTVNT